MTQILNISEPAGSEDRFLKAKRLELILISVFILLSSCQLSFAIPSTETSAAPDNPVINTGPANQINPEGYTEYLYKKIDTVELKIYVKNPKGFDPGKVYPSIIFFFGGGFNSGNINQFKPHADYLASRGMVAILADYRVKTRHGTTPFDAVSDAKSVIRYLRQNSATLHIDIAMIVASGGSAGGHLAAAAATVPGLDDGKDNLGISAKPNALVLYNPVFDNGPTGYGYERVGERFMEISPFHNIGPATPPTIVFLGTADALIPVETAQRYRQKMEEAGNRCDLFLYEGQKHGFFNFRDNSNDGNKYFKETLYQTDVFLHSLGYLQGKPAIPGPAVNAGMDNE